MVNNCFNRFFVVIAMFATLSQAVEITDDFTLNGFGTLGVSTNNRDDILYQAYSGSSLVGKNEFNVRTNTILGLQGTYNITDAFFVTAQGVVRDSEEESYQSQLQWAYMQYDSPWDFTIRAGQFRLPIFQTTELAYVGFARTWANPPLSFYGVGGFEFLQGVQLAYSTYVDDYGVTLRASYGHGEDELPSNSDPRIIERSITSDDIAIVSAKLHTDWFWVNVAYTQLSSELNTINDRHQVVNRRYPKNRTYSAEYALTYANVKLEGGYAMAYNDGLPDERLIYQSLAYQIGAFKPYVIYSAKYFSDFETVASSNPNAAPPTPIDESKTRDIRQGIGCRYDLYNGIALKYQFDRINNGYSRENSLNSSGDTGINHVHTLVADWMF